MNISSIVEKLNGLFDKMKTPAQTLPPWMLKATTHCRSGLSAYKTTAKIIENNQMLGIPTGKNPDGSENMINQYTYNIVKEIFNAIQNDAVVHNVLESNSIMVQAQGGNAGGPVVCTGFNILDTISKGIIR
jgi:hypothetical protein